MADKYRTVRINPPGVMLFAAAFDRSEKNKDPFATRHEDEWGLPTKTIEEVLTNAAAKTTSETGVQIEVGEVLPAYDGLHLLGDYQMLQLVHSAMNTEELESALRHRRDHDGIVLIAAASRKYLCHSLPPGRQVRHCAFVSKEAPSSLSEVP